ncbi:hypothetical protein GMORB2_4620 [Geosmithia morbida]|uniref:protein-tyrosine-phosphatase n=1 Tax=Geosmithia morbida TaxID=1094350 RepID=A0A9P4YMV0_9HYPO|nr:uncharacterized protein GMORB2_4620 [Geosmithia morbida]KAF4119490.1 hypothetical protein GMORB2_4620 [Geosmithia morbida]
MKTATKTAATGTSHPSYSHSYQSPLQAHSPSHSSLPRSSSHSHRAPKPSLSTTPLASPRYPYSVGQNYPPRNSPPARAPEPRPSSPNYFGLVVESTNDPRETSLPERNNWSPPSSSVKSFGAAIPAQVPLEANLEFEAFKRQADANRGKSFALPSASHVQSVASAALARPRPPRWHTHTSGAAGGFPFVDSAAPSHPLSTKMDVDQDSFYDSAYVSSESKRNSESSLYPIQLGGMPRLESPAPMERSSLSRSTLTRSEDRDPRMSVMEHKADPPSPPLHEITRSSTLPTSFDTSLPTMVSGVELRDTMKGAGQDHVLLLDIRSAQNHATARIKGSLNLCVPTTLLKRATFNIQKLHQTFQGGNGSDRFARWRDATAIIVYDSHTSDQRDATAAQNMIKKFTNEGFAGRTCILKGGFAGFVDSFPDMVERGSPAAASATGTNPAGGRPDGNVAPVIGGVTLPSTAGCPNPFFSNIRQNMDLADGVGQFPVTRPQGLMSPALPGWLRQAASEPDQGKMISEKFLQIEKDEKARMQTAYAAFDPHTAQQTQTVQICGVEKGGKNRYKDILPFEHARVKLQSKAGTGCDYVNASHVRPSGSNKRYIATQGPLPATYEDFWSMIWEQDVRVIVMLTAESEGGQLKCHPYWKEKEHGPIRLKQLSEKRASLDMDKHRAEATPTPGSNSTGDAKRRRANTTTTVEFSTPTPPATTPQKDASETPYVIIRKFALVHASHPFEPMREITHLHFPSWPDFGTPAKPSHLLGLIELANVTQRASMPVETTSVMEGRKMSGHMPNTWHDEPEADAKARPMLVHCSAGCGRTGTFCTVDSVIDMLKRSRQAKSAAQRVQNMDEVIGDGDIVGGPMADGEVTATSDLRTKLQQNQPPGASTIDSRWLGDDSVDLIQKTVEDFRQQRLSMVQSLRQYVLCYETVLEWEHRMNGRGLHTRRALSGTWA